MKKLIMGVAFCLSFLYHANAQALQSVTTAYLNVQKALANDKASDAASAAANLESAIGKVSMGDLSMDQHMVFMKDLKNLKQQSNTIATSNDIATQRKAFVEVSKSMIEIAKKDKISKTPIYEAYCPMKKASWLSDSKTIANPFYGTEMPTCGKVTATY